MAAILKFIFLYEDSCIFIQILMKCVPRGQIYNKPPLVQVKALLQLGKKPCSEQIMDQLTDAYMH